MVQHKNTKKGRRRLATQAGDFLVQDPEDTDIVIVVMGPTGAGKSTFVNTLLNDTVAEVGKGLRSMTTKVQHYILPHPHHPERRIMVVDTPGFDDTHISDMEILRRISTWLAESYEVGMKLAGLIYLHDISHRRLEGSKRINYEVFEKLCGDKGATKVVLATTMWGDVSKEVGAYREKELKEDFWSNMFNSGSTIHRVQLTKESALEIIDSVLSHGFAGGVEIQRELVDDGKAFTETAAYAHLQTSAGLSATDTGKILKQTWARRMLNNLLGN